MTVNDFYKAASEFTEAEQLGILTYLGKHESFAAQRDMIEEALYRTCAASQLAFEERKQSYEEYQKDLARLEQFCSDYGYDINNYRCDQTVHKGGMTL